MSKINKNAFQKIRTSDYRTLADGDDDLLDEVMEDNFYRSRRKGQPVLEDKVQFVRESAKVGGVSRFQPKPTKSSLTEDDE